MNARKPHQTVDGPAMHDPQPRGAIPHRRDRGRERRVLIVALDAVIPAEVPHWLEKVGVQAKGQVGDADPLLAIADALPTFPADEIMIAAHPEGSNRFADELVSRARNRFALPASRTSESLTRAA